MTTHPAYSYEQGDDGLFYFLLYGRRSTGFRTSDNEDEMKRRVADAYEDQRDADEAERKYNVQ